MKLSNMSSTPRDRILDAAKNLFSQYGYQRTSMVDIAKAAGLSRPALYLQFHSKDEVYLALAEAVVSRALIDAQGRIIGVNSAIATLSSGSTSGSIGLGFSIPINEAKRVIDEIISTGKSTRPVLGVFFDTTFTGEGAKIGKLSPGEGADKAGIPVGAIIRSIDGVKIPNTDTAIVRIRSYAPGATVSVVVDLPTGGSKTFKVTLGSAPAI